MRNILSIDQIPRDLVPIIIHTRKLGLEIWNIEIGGKIVHSFLSEQYAKMKQYQICIKLKIDL